jgi:hypothetical protein
MNIRKRLTITSALAALALGLTVAPASAQPAYKGSFELPVAAYWGNTLLQPGQYAIWTSTGPQRVWAIHLIGMGITSTLLNDAHPRQQSARSFLKMAEINGSYYIGELSAGPIGKSFQFGSGKPGTQPALRARAARTLTVRVSNGNGR